MGLPNLAYSRFGRRLLRSGDVRPAPMSARGSIPSVSAMSATCPLYLRMCCKTIFTTRMSNIDSRRSTSAQRRFRRAARRRSRRALFWVLRALFSKNSAFVRLVVKAAPRPSQPHLNGQREQWLLSRACDGLAACPPQKAAAEAGLRVRNCRSGVCPLGTSRQGGKPADR